MESISDRTVLLIGEEGAERLRGSFVVLAGVGAVGGYVFEALVRAGIGRIRVIDSDVFNETNLNRQILATKETVGRSKVEVAKERARSIDPNVAVETMDAMVSPDTIERLLSDSPDVLIDAIDTVGPKVALLTEASRRGIVTFSSMGAALHTDSQAIRIAPLKKTKVCPLASSVRSRLRDEDTSKIVCVYSEEKPLVTPSEKDDHGKSILGSIPTIPAIFGMTLANEAIMHLIKK